MASSYEALLRTLEQERDAARRADVDTLLQLQEVKSAAVQELNRSGLSQDRLAVLTEKARSNILLIRHLAQCLQGALYQDDDPVYTAAGQCTLPHSGYSRGNV